MLAGKVDDGPTPLCSQEEARRHFDCPVLEGMELENQGGTGTELNHWEKRLLEVRLPPAAPRPPALSSCSPPLAVTERGHDGLPHAEPGLLSPHAGHPGGQRLVPGQLQPGPEAGLGPPPRLRLCPQELQVLDGAAARQVRGQRSAACWDLLPQVCVCVRAGVSLWLLTATRCGRRRCSSPADRTSWLWPCATCRSTRSSFHHSSR